ncbi:MAG: HK97 gp10 family phage protein [Deltaproteobacteria bacterium]|nr:HK97 gp10 family phage protein [Deltaproteobacteria bacterium]
MSKLVKSYLSKALQTSENLLEEKLQVAGEMIVAQAKQLTPVAYGRAKSSVTWATSKSRSNPTLESGPKGSVTAKAEETIKPPKSKLTLRFGSAVIYFIWLEIGTKTNKRYAPLRLGLYKSLPNVKRVLAKK